VEIEDGPEDRAVEELAVLEVGEVDGLVDDKKAVAAYNVALLLPH
jgi:hypothetical protein